MRIIKNKLALLFFTLTLFACGGGSSSGTPNSSKTSATITGLPNELALNANTSMTYNLGGSGGDLTVDSSNKTVATVTLSGDTLTVNAISLGTTTITARRAETSTHNAVSSSFVLTVNKIQATLLDCPAN